MLGLQLTGAGCLEDWQISMSSDFQVAIHTAGITADLSGIEESADDGCPCHLAFVSVKAGSDQMISPVVLSDTTPPDAPPIPRPYTLFRPPLHS